MEIQPDESYKQIRVGDILKYSPYGIRRMEYLGFFPLRGHPNRQHVLKAIKAYRVRACEDYNANSVEIRCITTADPYHWWDAVPPGVEHYWQTSILMLVRAHTIITQTRRLTVKAHDG